MNDGGHSYHLKSLYSEFCFSFLSKHPHPPPHYASLTPDFRKEKSLGIFPRFLPASFISLAKRVGAHVAKAGAVGDGRRRRPKLACQPRVISGGGRETRQGWQRDVRTQGGNRRALLMHSACHRIPTTRRNITQVTSQDVPTTTTTSTTTDT